jgi:stage IV sporulation protein B
MQSMTRQLKRSLYLTILIEFLVPGNVSAKTLRRVVPVGKTIGVTIHSDVPVVSGTTCIVDKDGENYSPAEEAGVKIGDQITYLDNKKMSSPGDITKIVQNSGGRELSLRVVRDDRPINISVKPKYSHNYNKYMLGLLLTSDANGIGTLTFYDPQNRKFGALGHAITSARSGEIVQASSGEIFAANIMNIKRGRRGMPGEICGSFSRSNKKLGKLRKNSKFGLYGELYNAGVKEFGSSAVNLVSHDEVHEGKAYILSNINGSQVDKFEIRIEKVMRQSKKDSKSLIVKVTDNRLISIAGGIIQGMSGSPILQDGKLVGAVTHVTVNDPTKGYGIFAEWMLDEANS